MLGDELQPGMILRLARLLEDLHAVIDHLVREPDRALRLIGLVGIDGEPDVGADAFADGTNARGIELEASIDLNLDVAIAGIDEASAPTGEVVAALSDIGG